MNADTLLENFEILAEAPGGISSLKNLILEMAIGGRLVAQIADEGDSGVLVDEIVSSREVRLREKRLPIRQVPDVSDIQPSFEIPMSWRWIRLGSVCYPQAGFAFKSSEFNTAGKGLPLIRIRDISTDHTQCHYSGEYRGEFVVHSGDWLIGMDGNFSIHKWLGPVALLNQRVTRLIFLNEHISKRFVAWSLQHQIALLMGTKSYTTVDHLSTKQINEALIPIPPLAEQARIVEKVDELMALCDQLEQQQKHRDNLRTATRKSAIDAISTATTPEELETAWKRINNNFEILAEAPDGISRLRLLIVELAIRGRFSNVEKIDGNGFPPSWDNQPASDFFKSRSGNSKLIKGKLFNEFAEGRYPGYSASGQDVWLDSAEHTGEAAILSAVGARCGKAFRASGSWSAIANTHIIWLNDKRVVPDYGMLILNNEKFWIRSGSAQPFVKVKASLEQTIGIPPLAEQVHIVAKVNELMALCDQLEARLKVRSEVSEKFALSVVNAA